MSNRNDVSSFSSGSPGQLSERHEESSISHLFPRLGFISLYVLNLLTLGLLSYLLAPFTSLLFFDDLRFWRHWHKFHKLTLRSMHHTLALLRQSEYSQVFHVPWFKAPRMSPDRTRLRVRPEWLRLHGEHCDGCTTCCERIDCTLIDPDVKGCMVYGSFFWKYFTCGPFPENRRQIDYYGCEKWQSDV